VILLAYAAILGLSVALSRLRTRYPSPMILFCGVWTAMAAMYLADSYIFRIFIWEIPLRGHLVRLAALTAFLVGSALVWFAYPRRREFRAERPDGLLTLTYLLQLAFAICVAGRLWALVSTYGNPLSAVANIRDDFVSGRLVFPAYTSLGTVIANIIALNLGVLIGLGRRVHAPVFAFIVLAIFNDAAAADKAGMRLVVFLAFAAFFSRLLLRRRNFHGYIKYASMALAAFTVYSLITYLRVKDRSATFFEATLPHFYANISGNIASSAWFLEHPWPKAPPGVYSFRQFYLVLGLPGPDTDRMPAYVFAWIDPNHGFNTTDYLHYLTADFGIGGALLGSVVLGFISSWLYLRAKYFRTVPAVQLLAAFMVALVLSIRGFYFGAPGFWLTLGCIWLQGLYLVTLKRAGAPESSGELPSASAQASS
jgi:oligosaccharide repeat unit polymerase